MQGPSRWLVGMALMVLATACSSEPEPSGSPSSAASATSSTTVSAPSTAAPVDTVVTTTTTAAPLDPFAITEPLDVLLVGTCGAELFREDEYGKTWLLSCTFAHGANAGDTHLVLRSTAYDSHFRYVTDSDDEVTRVVLEAPLFGNQNCRWSFVDFEPLDVPIVDGEVVFDGLAIGTGGCADVTWSYTVTWDTESGEATIEGIVEPSS